MSPSSQRAGVDDICTELGSNEEIQQRRDGEASRG